MHKRRNREGVLEMCRGSDNAGVRDATRAICFATAREFPTDPVHKLLITKHIQLL